MNWLNAIKNVKIAIASKKPSYSQSKYITITVNSVSESVRTDCSGYVSSCLYYYGAVKKGYMTTSWGFSKSDDVASLLTKAGFKKMKFTSWTALKEGDIISQSNSHVEIFSHNLNGAHYVYSNGNTADMRSLVPTKDTGAHKYDTVWRLTKEPVDNYTAADFIKDLKAIFNVTPINKTPNKTLLTKTVTLSTKTNRTHRAVRVVQKRLYKLGYTEIGEPDGVAGEKFTKAVKNYQKKVVGLSNPDGIITAGCGTWKKLLGL